MTYSWQNWKISIMVWTGKTELTNQENAKKKSPATPRILWSKQGCSVLTILLNFAANIFWLLPFLFMELDIPGAG